MTVGDFCERVNDGCQRFGGSVISWTRSPARNASIDGHPKSRHLKGLACDIVFDNPVQTWRAFGYLKDRGLYGYVKSSGRSIHIQDRSAREPETRRA
jgi:uncharacterized protein YcbK (DUF882 family)